MSINRDAHSTRELDLTDWGVEMARKGGVPKDRVLNCRSKDELGSYLGKRAARQRIKSVPLRRESAGSRTSAAAIEKWAAPCKNKKVAVRSLLRARRLMARN